MAAIFPDLPLYLVSEFPPGHPGVRWVPYRINRSFGENFARCRAEFHGKSIRLAGVMLVPSVPFRRLRIMALLLAPAAFAGFNENLNHFMFRPQSTPAIARHVVWRAKNLLRHWRHQARHTDWRKWRWHAAARVAGFLRPRRRAAEMAPGAPRPRGVSVVIPSRNGKELLEAQLPAIAGSGAEIIVVDNGSDDGTAEWLRARYPEIVVEISPSPLSFARAVNRGIERARYSHVCLLNNDMLVSAGFFPALEAAFEQVPELFCATAQIRFPEGQRREETGKTVFVWNSRGEFPVRCDEPLPGEDSSYVLYGSGGCSLCDAGKLQALGGVDEAYDPAYVEDLDLGWRAWQRGWPSVYVAGAVVEHRHRATTSRYYTPEQLDRILEVNYLKFLARSVADGRLFRRLWKQALEWRPIREAAAIALAGGAIGEVRIPEEEFLALNDGSVAVFPGHAATGKPHVLVASPYVPFPLSHGGAVRIYNLMRRAAAGFDQILVAFTERMAPPAPELLAICAEVVLIYRPGSHSLPSRGRPEVVEEFASASFRAALRQTVRKWRPRVAQLEFTQMAQYAADCAPAKTILVEHDITFDLYEQLLGVEDNWELRRQLDLWRRYESQAWRQVDRVVVMSAKDRRHIPGPHGVILANGVDLERFRPAAREPEPRRLLFIGSFAHRPNVMAVEFFVNRVWPLLRDVRLHLIAGARHASFPLEANLAQAGIEMEGFVADVRPAYERAALVVAPLVASAGTNIKILEAMAMGKAVVSTRAGVNGLDLTPGEDFELVKTAEEMAATIEGLLVDAAERRRIERAARLRVERDFDWDHIARQQAQLYRELL
jgi:GT2 family glycosyltransferase/glycosyltransferase involved in cell wall biosynthesis